MNVILFGASGMVGQCVLGEAILDPEVKRIVSIVRQATPPDARPNAEGRARRWRERDINALGA
jgi:uncharacterized protein YbjT (DUF2867 family)